MKGSLFGLAFAAGMLLAQSPDKSSDISGKWEIQVEGVGAPRTQRFELKQKGENLTGAYAGKFGESKVTGTVKDKEIEFEMKIIENEHIVTVHYTGTPVDDGLKGTVTFGDEGKGTWIASRSVVQHKK